MTFAIKVDKSSFAGIHYLTRKLKNPSDLLKEIGEIVVEDIRHRIISSKKDINDRAFAPWAESTRKARQKALTNQNQKQTNGRFLVLYFVDDIN